MTSKNVPLVAGASITVEGKARDVLKFAEDLYEQVPMLDELKQKYEKGCDGHELRTGTCKEGNLCRRCKAKIEAIEDVRKEIHDRIKDIKHKMKPPTYPTAYAVQIDELERLAGEQNG